MFKIVTKNIANMHCEHDVSDFFKHHLKIALLRIGKHCIVKKSEHRPPLQTTSSICIPIHYWIHIVFMTLDTAILPFQKFTPGCLQPKSCATIILSPPSAGSETAANHRIIKCGFAALESSSEVFPENGMKLNWNVLNIIMTVAVMITVSMYFIKSSSSSWWKPWPSMSSISGWRRFSAQACHQSNQKPDSAIHHPCQFCTTDSFRSIHNHHHKCIYTIDSIGRSPIRNTVKK